ncbi:MAG: LssY C-terminal domain-containing protein [Phycisphaerae bacterium]|nr:LssY C-terminal domain-containing protein [Phycisphaerae bacterium]
MSRKKRVALLIAAVLLVWAVVAYLVMPDAWEWYVGRHPALEDIPDVTHTAAGIPGDPLNVGDNPRKRHHVRFWRSEKTDPDGRPLWIGSATYDERVGLSHTTGQVTHHIAADVDAERDHLLSNLEAIGELSEAYTIDDFHKTRQGRNGGGDPWHTDGRLLVGVITAE